MAAESEIQERIFEKAGPAMAAGYRAAIRDGAIDAFLRQGANELGAALKAFPDAIQIDEPGAVFNPLYSDIAADKRANALAESPAKKKGGDLPSPSAIAGSNATAASQGESQDMGSLPTPSQIAVGRAAGPEGGTIHGENTSPLPSPAQIGAGVTTGGQDGNAGNAQNQPDQGQVMGEEHRGRGR